MTTQDDVLLTDGEQRLVAALKRIRAAIEFVADIRDQQNLQEKTAPLRSDLQLRQDIVELDASIAEMEGAR